MVVRISRGRYGYEIEYFVKEYGETFESRRKSWSIWPHSEPVDGKIIIFSQESGIPGANKYSKSQWEHNVIPVGVVNAGDGVKDRIYEVVCREAKRIAEENFTNFVDLTDRAKKGALEKTIS